MELPKAFLSLRLHTWKAQISLIIIKKMSIISNMFVLVFKTKLKLTLDVFRALSQKHLKFVEVENV